MLPLRLSRDGLPDHVSGSMSSAVQLCRSPNGWPDHFGNVLSYVSRSVCIESGMQWLILLSGAHIVSQTAPDLCTRYTGYTSTTVVDATATSVVHNNFFVETAIVVSWTGGEKPQTTSTPSSSTTMTATAARGSVAAAPVVPEPDLGINPERVRQTATTIAFAVGCSIGSVVLIAMILGLITLRRHRKQKAQTQARLDQARLGRAGDEHGPVSTDLPPMYAARQSMETLPGYEARNPSRSSLAKM